MTASFKTRRYILLHDSTPEAVRRIGKNGLFGWVLTTVPADPINAILFWLETRKLLADPVNHGEITG